MKGKGMKVTKISISLAGILLLVACCVYAQDESPGNPGDDQGAADNTPAIEDKQNTEPENPEVNEFKPEPTTEPVGRHLETDQEESVNNPDGPDGGSVSTESVNNPHEN